MLCVNYRPGLVLHVATALGAGTVRRYPPPGRWKPIHVGGHMVGRLTVAKVGSWWKVMIDAPGVAVWHAGSTPAQLAASEAHVRRWAEGGAA
jgi:hypothetical protein